MMGLTEELHGNGAKFFGMLADICEKAMLFAFAAIDTIRVVGVLGQDGEGAAFHAQIDGAPRFLNGGEGDFEFLGDFFVNAGTKCFFKQALLGRRKPNLGSR